jgi:hypothetical protein
MMRDFLCGIYRASGFENKKPIWASDRFRLRERSWFATLEGKRTSELSLDPPWPLPARLAEPAFEGQLVPDARSTVRIGNEPSRLFFGFFRWRAQTHFLACSLA